MAGRKMTLTAAPSFIFLTAIFLLRSGKNAAPVPGGPSILSNPVNPVVILFSGDDAKF